MKKHFIAAALGSVLMALSHSASAQSTDQLVRDFTTLAGSEENAKSLVHGLRDGSSVALESPRAEDAQFTPPTGKMGNGNVNIALSLARASLHADGVTEPTPQQLKAAVLGVLEQRADGRGWGEIAQSSGFKLGDVMRSERAQAQNIERQPAGKPERVARAGHEVQRPVRVEKPERPARVEKPERPVRPERPERPEHAGRPAR